MTSGYLSIKEPTDLERVLARAINKVLTRDDCINHIGKIASLANAWTNCRKLKLDSDEIKLLEERLTRLERLLQERNGNVK